jgi:Domain of unknown function (DUF4326)
MPKPRRLKLSRKKGARLPKGAVVVARPTKWGNPYRPDEMTRAQAVAKYQRNFLAGKLKISVEDVRRELKGHDLACWCPLNGPCHADLLIKIANAKR